MLSIDIEFGIWRPSLECNCTFKYVQKLMTELNLAYQVAQDVIKKEQEWHKHHYNQNIWCSKLEHGDWALIRQNAYKGKHKIQDQ